MYKEDIDIFLITYNRAEKLERTLNKLLAGDSPIKDYEIKILDNASTDETETLCREFSNKYSNIIYCRNRINIGLSGNIIKAMESAERKWLWVLCDDDDYDWSNWEEIDIALSSNEYDIVHTTYTKGQRNETYPYLIGEEAFIPTPIYNTKHITPLTMQNAYAMAYTLLPHHAIGCKVINEKGRIYVPKERTVLQGRSDKYNFLRIPPQGLFHRFANYQILAGYIAAYQLIEDEEIRRACCDMLCLGSDFEYSMECFLEWNNGYINNIVDVLIVLDPEQRRTLFKAMSNKPKEKYQEFVEFIRDINTLYRLFDI
jgi:glycosyltransferase involved in cell wall biosynthesis